MAKTFNSIVTNGSFEKLGIWIGRLIGLKEKDDQKYFQ